MDFLLFIPDSAHRVLPRSAVSPRAARGEGDPVASHRQREHPEVDWDTQEGTDNG
jgi:hypothetical protein